jgi:dihydroflavonol-4-reductase
VLVTGATGFLGSSLARSLRLAGRVVRGLARPGADGSRTDALAATGIEVVGGDVLDPPSLRRAMEGVTEVYHLAGRLFAPRVPAEAYERVHVEGAGNVVRAAAAGGVRAVVHCSTTGVLGPTGPTTLPEDAPEHPSNAYESSKARGERVVRELAADAHLPLAIARPGLVYGPGDRHLLGWFRAIRNGYYRVVGPGDNRLHPVYVDDVVDGLQLCAERGLGDGRAYNLVGERALPIRELAAAIADAVGRPLPRHHFPRAVAGAVAAVLEAVPGLPAERLPLTRSRIAFMTESRAYCGCRARDELGFVPRVGLGEGLHRTVEWYRREGLL